MMKRGGRRKKLEKRLVLKINYIHPYVEGNGHEKERF